MKTDEEAKNDALIRFFYKKDPDLMNDDEWCKASAEIDFCLFYTGQIVRTNG